MSRLVIDASVAIKWVVNEDGTKDAIKVYERGKLSSPDLLIVECANVLWKKVRRKELSQDAAIVAANLLQRTDVEIVPTRHLMENAMRLALELDHAAYDCLYLALAEEHDWPFVTADDRLRRKLAQSSNSPFNGEALSMKEAVLRG